MKTIINICLGILCMAATISCKKLVEEQFGQLSPQTYYQTKEEALSSVAAVYSALSGLQNVSAEWTISEEGSDEFICPGRASGGWYDQNNVDIYLHDVSADNQQVANAWTDLFHVIGLANSVITSLQASPIADSLKPEIAECQALRAWAYLYTLDFWGNVPIVTADRIDQNNLPKSSPKDSVAAFVEAQLLTAAESLPSVKDITKSDYYPRLTKEAAYTALATLYLNDSIYTGISKWQEVIDVCDKVISSNAYALMPNVSDNFNVASNGISTEVIFAFTNDPSVNAGGNNWIIYCQPALDQQKYNLPFGPANGFATLSVALNRYEAKDNRLKSIEYGPQYYQDGKTPLTDAKGIQLDLVNVKSMTAAADNEGYRVLKYSPVGAVWSGFSSNCDFIQARYSDILLMKAEAEFRTGNVSDALRLINQVRTRSNATPFTTLTLQKIEDERAREFIYEGQRRRDMIRFGDFFTGNWEFKTTTDPAWKGLYPIPADQIANNPNLIQNKGY